MNNNSKKLYLILEELYYLNSNKFKYGIDIFNDLCLPFSKDKIINTLKKKYILKNNNLIISELENTFIEINKACIIIETSKNAPEIFKYLNEIEKNIFVCDFINKDYFILNTFIHLNLKITI